MEALGTAAMSDAPRCAFARRRAARAARSAAIAPTLAREASARGDLIVIDGSDQPGGRRLHPREPSRTQRADGAAALVIQLDTPGGLLTSTQSIVKELLGAPLPVIVYVAPSGASAASAGRVRHDGGARRGDGAGHEHRRRASGRRRRRGDIERRHAARRSRTSPRRSAVDRAAARPQRRVGGEGRARERLDHRRGGGRARRSSTWSRTDLDRAARPRVDGTRGRGRRPRSVRARTLGADDRGARRLEMRLEQRVLDVDRRSEHRLPALDGGPARPLRRVHASRGRCFPGVAGAHLPAARARGVPGAADQLDRARCCCCSAWRCWSPRPFVPSFGVLGVGGLVAFVLGSLLLFDAASPTHRGRPRHRSSARPATVGGFMLAGRLPRRARAAPRRYAPGRRADRRDRRRRERRRADGGKVFVHGEYWDAVSDDRRRAGDAGRGGARRAAASARAPAARYVTSPADAAPD